MYESNKGLFFLLNLTIFPKLNIVVLWPAPLLSIVTFKLTMFIFVTLTIKFS